MRTASLLAFFPIAAFGATAPSFSDVLAIFASNCGGCHTASVKMGSLDLDTYEGIRRGGNHGTILIPGRSEDSRLYLMIAGKLAPAMPMNGKSMKPADVEAVRQWIDAGAPGAPEPAKTSAAPLSQPAPSAPARPAAPVIAPSPAVKPQVASLAWNPDGTLLAAGSFGKVTLLSNGSKPVGTVGPFTDTVRAIAFSPDGTWFAAAAGLPGVKGEVRLWNTASRAELRSWTGHTDCIYALAISPDGKTVATASYDKLIKLWDPQTGQELRTLKDHIDAVYALAFNRDGSLLLSASADRSVKVWNPATGERLYTLSEPIDGLNTLALDPAGRRVAAAGLDKTIRIWTLGKKGATLDRSLIAHEDSILALAWSPDGSTLVSSAADRSLKVFRASDLSEVRSIANQADWVVSLSWSPDGKKLAAGRFDGTLEILDSTLAGQSSLAVNWR